MKPIFILGITGPISQENGAALLKDGELIAAVEEQKLLKTKHTRRLPPLKSIEFVLKNGGITIDDIDQIAIGYRSPLKYYLFSFIENIKCCNPARAILEGGAFAEYCIRMHSLKMFLNNLSNSGLLKLSDNRIASTSLLNKISYIPHHIAHAASAFRVSGFSQANIITSDGQGEDDAGLIGYGSNNKIYRLKKISSNQSLGWLYSKVTELIGFTEHSHEGKTMGLAAYGSPEHIDFSRVVESKDGYYRLKRGWLKHLWTAYIKPRKTEEPIEEIHKHLASKVQVTLEEIGVVLAKFIYNKTKFKKLCLAGGTALNCDLNSAIARLPFVEDIFVQPAANDVGTAIGAAFEVYAKMGFSSGFIMEHAYWGPEYSNEEIESVLRESSIKYMKLDNIEKVAARAIADGKIVGWFQGKQELGPRALGNRSILANPSLEGMKDKINLKVKHREAWRPFAPAVLHEYGNEYFENYRYSPFMLLTFNAKKNKVEYLKEAVHVDNTSRIQSVKKAINPRFYSLIDEFRKMTGIPAIINTSFNDKEEPIVVDPKSAIRTFYSTGLDILAIGDFWLEK